MSYKMMWRSPILSEAREGKGRCIAIWKTISALTGMETGLLSCPTPPHPMSALSLFRGLELLVAYMPFPWFLVFGFFTTTLNPQAHAQTNLQ
jgi:hypothetical protein